MASRDIASLEPAAQRCARRVLDSAKQVGLEILIYCTYRSPIEQARLYRRGRPLSEIRRKAIELADEWGRPDLADLLMQVGPQYGRKATNAGPGQSMHNYGLAFDAVPLVDGKPVWGDETDEEKALWRAYGRIGEDAGLDWAGRWHHFVETPHMQLPDHDWRDLIRG